MHKYELEQQLMDPEGVKRLVDRAMGIKERYGGASASDGEDAERVEQIALTRSLEEPASAEDLDFITLSDMTISLTHFIPESQEVDPQRILAAVTDRCQGDPSEANQVLLQDAINELITTCELDSKSSEVLSEAMKVLESVGRPQGERGRTS